MPTKTIASLNADGVQILNTIRANQNYDYQSRVPLATRNNLAEVGQAILDYEPTKNAFLSALVNRIARIIITSKSYTNPLKPFKKGLLAFGETVEEVFVNIAQAHQFDPAVAENEVYKREIPDVEAIFHRMNLQNFYKATISNEQLRQAFLSWQGIDDLIGRIVDSLYTGSEYDEFITMKQLIAQAAQNGDMYPVTIPAVNATNAKEIVTQIKSISNSLEFMSNQYNGMGVLTHSKKDDQILLLNTELDAVTGVNVLATSFNMQPVGFMGHRVLVDEFTGLNNVPAVLVDRNWFMVFDNLLNFTENYNGQGMYWNYFYHVWKTFSYSLFSNAVLFTTDTNAVNTVTVTPATPSVSKGQTVQFSAAVAGTGYPNKAVTWSVSGDSAVTSTIDYKGLLTINANEANTTLTVTATSIYDSSKSGTATVTIA